MIILELENRCTGNRTEGSNPSLSAISCCFSEGWLGAARVEAVLEIWPLLTLAAEHKT